MATSGILAVLPQDPSIDGLYPVLSASRQPRAQELRFSRGDAFVVGVQLQDDADPPNVASLDGCLVRFTVKQGFGTYVQPQTVGNEAAMIQKTSRDATGLDITDAALGRALIRIDRDDTWLHPIVPAVWDLEVLRPDPDSPVVTPFVATTVAGDATVTFGASLPAWLRAGHILTLDAAVYLITKVNSDTSVEIDAPASASGTATAVVKRAFVRTIARGPWVCEPDVTL